MEILALAIASLSLLVAIVGTYLANARAKEALDLSRSTAVDTQWSAAQAAIQHLIGFDPKLSRSRADQPVLLVTDTHEFYITTRILHKPPRTPHGPPWHAAFHPA